MAHRHHPRAIGRYHDRFRGRGNPQRVHHAVGFAREIDHADRVRITTDPPDVRRHRKLAVGCDRQAIGFDAGADVASSRFDLTIGHIEDGYEVITVARHQQGGAIGREGR